MTTIRVHLDSAPKAVPVGTAQIVRGRGVDTTEFTYDSSFIAAHGWDISPDLPVARGATAFEGLPGALDDASPDRWGQNLITRHRAAQARAAGCDAPTLGAADYLLGVSDLTRQGALRFCTADGEPFLAPDAEVPRLIALADLYEAARAVDDNSGSETAVAALLAAGSGSLGGARPKASVTDGDTLYLAKFPRSDDQWEVLRWEAVALDIAAQCGLSAPPHRLVELSDGAAVLLVARFDRDGQRRIPYLSAHSLIGLQDQGSADYLALADALAAHGSAVHADLDGLWQRVALSVLLNNTDDHMRNHGFVRRGGGWVLAPVFDVNPDPRPTAHTASSLAGAVTPTDRLEALVATAGRFGLTDAGARRRWNALLEVVSSWRTIGTGYQIDAAELDRFAAVFDRWQPI